MSDTICLEPGNAGVLWLGLLSINELEAPEAKSLVPGEVVAHESLFQERRGGIRVAAVRRIVGAPKPELTLCCNRRDGVDRKIEFGRCCKLELPVPFLDLLRHTEANQRFGIAVGLGRGRCSVPLARIDS